MSCFWTTNLIFNGFFKYKNEPQPFKKKYSHLKERDRRNCENYRGLGILPSIGRLYGKIIQNKIENRIKNKIGDNQACFTAGRSCMHHIYTKQQLIEKKSQRIGPSI